MDFLHYSVNLGPKDSVEVKLDKQANVCLLDGANFSRYKRGDTFSYYGGLARVSPFVIPAPRGGRWHLVIDQEGRAGAVRASVSKVKG